MKKEKSTASVVTTHILTTSIIFPFFGLIAVYFTTKYLSSSLNQVSIVFIRDIIYIAFFFAGVKYSSSYIKKNILVKDPQSSLKYSSIVFAIIIACMLIFDVLANPNIISLVYNSVFFGIIYAIFFLQTKSYFLKINSQKPA